MAPIGRQVLGTDTKTRVNDAPLYQAIRNLDFAEVDTLFPFEAKLAYQCSWTKGYTTRVIKEYRRFLYLTQVSTVPIAPSDAVDQAWHLHLLQTHFYWDVMCISIFGKPLHHTPTISGPDGRESDVARYLNVLRVYREIFKEDPGDYDNELDPLFDCSRVLHLRVGGLLGKMTGTVYEEQVTITVIQLCGIPHYRM